MERHPFIYAWPQSPHASRDVFVRWRSSTNDLRRPSRSGFKRIQSDIINAAEAAQPHIHVMPMCASYAIIRRPTYVEGLKFCCWTFFITEPWLLDGRGETAHQMYTRGSVVGRTSFFHSYILPTPPWILQGLGKKCEIRPQFSTSLAFELPSFRNGAKSKTNLASVDDCPISSPHLIQLGPNTPKIRPEAGAP